MTTILCIMTTREDIPNDFMRFVKNGRVKQGTWKQLENHKIYADWLEKQLGYETMEDWYQITVKSINDNYGSGLLVSKYNNSPIMFLESIFPDTEWLPWKFKTAPQGLWKKIENHKIYADWLGKQLGYKNMNDWYEINGNNINDNYGGGLLVSKYNGSPIMFLESVFPDTEWLPWKFAYSGTNFWNDKEIHKTYAHWLGKKLGYKNMDDWYQITVKSINDNHGRTLLKKYNDSPIMFLESVFPDTEWLPWKFAMISRCYWICKENHKTYIDWLGKELGYKNMDDWYQITGQLIKNNHGRSLLGKYGDSTFIFLKSVFPDTEWLPWKLEIAPHGLWNDKENHIKYANWLGEELGYKNMDDWYQINKILLHDNHGSTLLQRKYKGSPKIFVTSIYPDYPWDLSKFKKNYSQGQLEWLNYLSIKKYLDVRHALNHNDGEYSIPNSRYHADGYSETENMILEYHGDYYHGNPEIYNQEELNKRTKTTYGELYQKTLKKQRFCEESGYNYISIWESEWFRFKNSIIHLQRIFKEKQFTQNTHKSASHAPMEC